MDIPGLLVKRLLLPQQKRGQELVAQGAVRIKGEKLADFTVPVIKSGYDLLQAGKAEVCAASI